MFNKFQDKGTGRKYTFFPDQCVKMWGNSKIKNPRQSNFKSSKIHFHKTLLFSFVFIFVIFSIYFCFYFCICWHSADEWCHGRTSRNRTVQILILKNKMWRLWWTFYSIISFIIFGTFFFIVGGWLLSTWMYTGLLSGLLKDL